MYNEKIGIRIDKQKERRREYSRKDFKVGQKVKVIIPQKNSPGIVVKGAVIDITDRLVTIKHKNLFNVSFNFIDFTTGPVRLEAVQ